MPFVRTLLAAGAVGVLAACGGSADNGAGAPEGQAAGDASQVVEIAASEFALDPAEIALDEAGAVTLRLTNTGSTVHALQVEGEGIQAGTEVIQPGETAELTVELGQGRYVLYCPVGDHRGRGMEGMLGVGEPASPGGGSEDEAPAGGYGGYGS